MSHYDYDDKPKYSLEEGARILRERLDQEKKERQENYDRAIAEGRRFLRDSRDGDEMNPKTVIEEIEYLAKVSRNVAQQAFHDLKNHKEMVYVGFSDPITRGDNLKEPNQDILSLTERNYIPAQKVEVHYNEQSPSNVSRAVVTQRFIQNQLNSGNTILVRKPDGTTEEVQFTFDSVASQQKI